MVALVLIIDYTSPNRFPFSPISHKYKATNIYEYFTPYVCLISTLLHHPPKCKVTNFEDTAHLVLTNHQAPHGMVPSTRYSVLTNTSPFGLPLITKPHRV